MAESDEEGHYVSQGGLLPPRSMLSLTDAVALEERVLRVLGSATEVHD
jgi:hypothetical protein